MKRGLQFSVVFLSLLGVAIVACSKKGDSRFGNVSGKLSEEMVKSIANSPQRMSHPFVGDNARLSVQGLGEETSRIVRRTMFRLATSPLAEYEPRVTGNQTDSDKDDIPVDAFYELTGSAANGNIQAKFHLRDQDDSLKLPKSGFFFEAEAANGMVLNDQKAKIEFNTEPSKLDVNITDAKASFDTSFLGTMKSGNSKVVFGFEGNGNYTGNVNAEKEGDTGSFTGMVKYEGESIPEIANASFVIKLEGEFTLGKCGSSSRALLKTGRFAVSDSENNRLEFQVANCQGTLLYNSQVIPIQGRSSVGMTSLD